jgi:hypothetical protein
LEFSLIKKHNFGKSSAGEIMLSNGLPSSNDVEMILQAFIEKRTQWFYFDPPNDSDYEVSISKAKKNPIIIYEKIRLIEKLNDETGEIEETEEIS